MDTLKLKVYPKDNSTEQDVIRVDRQAYDKLMEIQRESGLSLKYIASEMIRFAADRIEIVKIDLEKE